MLVWYVFDEIGDDESTVFGVSDFCLEQVDAGTVVSQNSYDIFNVSSATAYAGSDAFQ